MHIHLLHQDNIKGQALRVLLKDKGHEVNIYSRNPLEPMDAFKEPRPPFLILIDTTYLSGLNHTSLSHLYNCNFKIILLGKLEDLHWLFEFSENSVGFVCRAEKVKNLYQSIESLRNGEFFLSPCALQLMGKSKLDQQNMLLSKQFTKTLTNKELILLREIGKGKTSDQIAGEFFNSKHTINNHRKNIIGKLGLEKNLGLIKFSIENSDAIQTLLTLEKHKKSLAKFKNDYL